MGLCSKARDLKTVNCALSAEADLSVYQRDFEGALLERTTMYYARRSAEWLVLETRDYLAKVEGALAGEVDRCREYLHASSESKMLKVIEHELLQRHVCALVDRDVGGMHALLLADRDDDLKRMCKMFKNVPEGLAVMAVSFKKFVQMRGHAVLEARAEAVQLAKAAAAKEKSAAEDSAVRDDSGEAALHTGGQKAHKTADGAVLIQGFLALHSKMKAKVADLFLGEGAFRRALKEALQDVLNCDAATDATNVRDGAGPK
ncbi:Cullin repeat-like-containing domain protein [Pelagophyceae sp. CCMP2097]|nr:Cullin repeat-like-containing domain protein [Pelagophyceae sp. CCMP2097]